MTYHYWQQLHKQAYERQAQAEIKTTSAEEVRARAWAYLSRHCTETELAKLTALAQRYAAEPSLMQ